jgi:AcrR family transcriptional regulator
MPKSAAKFDLLLPPPDKDGRKQRSQSSRARIVRALLHLVANGDYAPSAAKVAEAAGVGLRSVFRHFDDMDLLYREMAETISANVLPLLHKPLEGDDWRERLLAMAQCRARVFEMMLPYRISANLKRFQSEFLMQDYRRLLRMEKSLVEAQLPDSVRADAVAVHAINAVLSFQNWRLLRHDHALPVEEAQAVVERLLRAALADVADGLDGGGR